MRAFVFFFLQTVYKEQRLTTFECSNSKMVSRRRILSHELIFEASIARLESPSNKTKPDSIKKARHAQETAHLDGASHSRHDGLWLSATSLRGAIVKLQTESRLDV
jgi:hypothetical protein